MGTHSILLVEPAASLAQAYVNALRRDAGSVRVVETAAQADAALRQAPADLVLLNLQLPDKPGLEVLKQILARPQPPRVIVMSSQGSVQLAIDVMRAGASDLLLSPLGTDKLRGAVAAALAGAPRVQAPTAPAADAPAPEQGHAYFGFIGASPQMMSVYRLIDSAAPSKATVFITGESGTGKEVCAEAIHRRSPRGAGPFVAINCAAIPKDLMESEIFGHVKGAFTGATSDHSGAALQANGGTLFLDELCEMDLSLQAKLLRFLQTGMVKKVGSEKLEPVDVRIVCATNRDPYAEVQAGRFREDLFYRLQVISIELPPLRERGDDILLIAGAFLEKFTREEGKRFLGFSPEAQQILRTYGWPGNVRQLLNVVRNVVVLNDGTEIQPFMLPPPLNKPTMIVPPMLSDPRWAAMAGPLPFQFAQPAAANTGPSQTGAPQASAVPPPAPSPTTGIAGPFAAMLGVPPATGAALPGTPVHVPDAPRQAPANSGGTRTTDGTDPRPPIRPLWQVEEDAIEEAIRVCGGNITRAAILLEINPSTIHRRRQRRQARG